MDAPSQVGYVAPRPWEPNMDEGFSWLAPVANRALTSDGTSVFLFNEEAEVVARAPRAPLIDPGKAYSFLSAAGVAEEAAKKYAVVSYVDGVGVLVLRTSPKEITPEAFAVKLSTFNVIG